MLPLCADQGIGVIPWSPLARGRLTRDWDATTARSRRRTQFGSSLYSDERPADRRRGRRGRRRARGAPGPGRAGLAAAPAGGDGADRRRDQAAAPRGRGRRGRPRAVRRRGRATRGALLAATSPRASELTDKVGRVGETRIVLVRHGESLGAGTAGRRRARMCGAVRPRRAPGRGVARPAAAVRGAGRGHRALLSVMARAVQTARNPRPGAGRPRGRAGLRVLRGPPERRERRDGWEEFDQRWPAPAEWSPDVAREPGGESYARDAGPRFGPARQARRAARGETVVVVCHGGVVVHSMLRWLDIEPLGGRTRAWLDPVNSSLTEWRMAENPMWRSEIELVRFNDHGHLRGDLLPRSRRATVAESDVPQRTVDHRR